MEEEPTELGPRPLRRGCQPTGDGISGGGNNEPGSANVGKIENRSID